MRTLLFTVAFLCCMLPSFSSIKADNLPVVFDSSEVKVRQFSNNALREYRTDSEFNYGEVRQDFAPTLWERFWAGFWDLIRSAFDNAAAGGIFIYIFIGLGSAALLFLAFKLSGMESAQVFSGNTATPIQYNENSENIHTISFERALEDAINHNNLRLAVRILYLHTLKVLSDKSLINWEAGKTNSDYVAELKNPSQKELFKELTRRFEYVWYGGFPIDRSLYDKISQSFNQFNKR